MPVEASRHALDLVAMVHLIVLAMWGGVVATEAVVELYSFRKEAFADVAIRLHYWIDLLVELPLLLAVIGTGVTAACLSDHLTRQHVVKIAFAGSAISINLFCIAVVLWRERQRAAGAPAPRLRSASRVVLACFAVGLTLAAVAIVLGFSLALHRMR